MISISYVYLRDKNEPGLWTVGFYDPAGEWHAETDYNSPEGAAARVHWLNGGVAEAMPELVKALHRAEAYLQGIRTGKTFEESDLVGIIQRALVKVEGKEGVEE